jgi:glucose-1-phosphatase
MKKRIISGVLGALLTLPALGATQEAPEGYQLRQVLMMSRHNLRAPLANNGSVLEQSTSRPWPKWEVPGGQLTTKGGVLEIYMGRYMRQWLGEQGLVKGDDCPGDSQAYIYANSLQRTVATAQFFAAGAFPGCNIQVHHQAKMGTMDPVFNPVITRDDPAFSKAAVSAMEAQRSRYALDDSFKLLEEIADYKDSPVCKEQHQCELSGGKDSFSARQNQEPGVSGPLKVGNSLVDAFTLQYYEGFPEQEVAWGEIKSDRQWQLLSALKNSYQESLFTSPQVARNVAEPLINYIDKTLEAPADKAPALTVLVGHDSNIASLLSALNFRPYQLPGQYEHTPIGGKLVFQRWHDGRANRELMKVEYVYQSSDQLRKAQPLSLENPPQRVTLELAGCPTDDNGFCPMDKFNEVMRQAVAGK